MPPLWSPARVPPQVRHVPNLRARAGTAWRAPGCEKGFVVSVVTDPIADMLTRIRNANEVRHASVTMPGSKMKEGVARILMQEGFIDGFDVKEDGPGTSLTLTLKYGPRREQVIRGLKRLSSPGRRVYAKAVELPRAQGGLGVVVVSTSQGLLPDREARRRKLGGELVCEVW